MNHPSVLMKIPNYLTYSLSFLWLWSGLQPILFAYSESLEFLARVGIPESFRLFVFLSASGLDLIFSGSYFFNWQRKRFYLAQFLAVLLYSFIIGIFLTEMWLHPFAPLIKNVPILALLFYLWRNS